MEVQILRYYLKVFSKFFFIFFIILIIYSIIIINKSSFNKNNIIAINKGENINIVINKFFFEESILNKIIFKNYYRLYKFYNSSIIHYGHFKINENTISFKKIINLITKPSNILNKITIIEGWSKQDLNNELSKYFENYKTIPYNDILADTYYFNKYENFEIFYDKIKKYKTNYINEKIKNKFFNRYTENDLFIIGSLIEKEGFDYHDKKQISSVIINRLEIGMRLQIDATVIYALTNGDYDLKRKLTLKDLKIKHPFNTYIISGLPPEPISYVGTKTIDIILENYKSDLLFYFFNSNLKKHVFSENFTIHKNKLNEYRKAK